jgi:PAS domain S-box-containing protein
MNSFATKLAESLVSKNEELEKLRIIVDACPVATFISAMDGLCIYVNKSYQELVGRSYDDILGDGWHWLIHTDDRDEVTHKWNAAVNFADSYDQEYRVWRPDGTVIPVHCRAVKLPTGNYVGYINATDGRNCKFVCAAKITRQNLAA